MGEAHSDPFTPLNNELWQTVPDDEAAIVEVSNPQPAQYTADTSVVNESSSSSVVAPTPAPAAEPTPVSEAIATEIRDPFADSRWVDLEDGPQLAIPSETVNRQPQPVVGPRPEIVEREPRIAELPRTDDDATEEPWNPNLGLIAPRGHASYQIANVDTEEMPQPVIDSAIKPIQDIVPFFEPDPMPLALELPTTPTERQFIPSQFNWQASNVYSNPLYFEDFALERYGHTHHPIVQPFASVGKFGVQFIGLPYKMAIDPVWDEEYALGWYQPGELAPHLFYQVPWNWKAAATAAGTYTGLIFLFP